MQLSDIISTEIMNEITRKQGKINKSINLFALFILITRSITGKLYLSMGPLQTLQDFTRRAPINYGIYSFNYKTLR